MIAAAIALAYVVAGLFIARYAFGWIRAKCIDENRRRYPSLYPTTASAVKGFQDERGLYVMAAFLVWLLWPAVVLVPVALWFARFVDKSGRLSQAEYRDRLAARDRRIADLEREAGIR